MKIDKIIAKLRFLKKISFGAGSGRVQRRDPKYKRKNWRDR